jgi:hypothetical protein
MPGTRSASRPVNDKHGPATSMARPAPEHERAVAVGRRLAPGIGHDRRRSGYHDLVTQPEPLPEFDQRTDVHPIEEREDVVDAAEDDTTVPGFPVSDAAPDELTPRFREPL